MLDVLHYLFEEDLVTNTGEQLEARDRVRSSIYKEFYESSYRYSSSKSSSNHDYGFENIDGPMGDIPSSSSTEVKPFFPATNFDPDAANPFGAALREAPLG